jgi:methyl-accepting chemotaxis protein
VLGAVLAGLLPLGAAYQWGWAAGLAVAVTASLAVLVGGRRRPGDPGSHTPTLIVQGTPGERSGDPGAGARRHDTGLAAKVLPVWHRHLETARGHAESSAGDLLQSFASVQDNLGQALGETAGAPSLDLGLADDLVERHRPQINRLLESTRQAVQLKDRMGDALLQAVRSLDGLARLAQEVQAIGRATNLLALNASVEATRAGASGAGFAVVAREVQALAAQSRQAAQGVSQQVREMRQLVESALASARRVDTHDDELVAQAEERAHEVVIGLLDGLAEATRSSRTLRATSEQVQADLDRIMVSLQSQDRQAQMLGSVMQDIERLQRWLEGQDDEHARSAADWLARLEQSYTMEEMHSSHHGTTTVERAPAVEFF